MTKLLIPTAGCAEGRNAAARNVAAACEALAGPGSAVVDRFALARPDASRDDVARLLAAAEPPEFVTAA